MNETLLYIIIAIVAISIGFLLGNYIQNLKTKSSQSKLEEENRQLDLLKVRLENRNLTLENEREELRKEKEGLGNQIVRYQADLENLQAKNNEQKEEVEKLQEKFTKEFENLANKILDEKSEKFTKSNKENIENILNPLKEKIKTFEDKVDKTHKDNIDYHSALRQQIIGLKELNNQMSKEANNLTRALKGDSKTQGNWGELILTRVLEKSGLIEGREYTLQDSVKSEDGQRFQTDVLIHLPDGKKMIIDSKVSIRAFERFVSEEDETLKEQYLKQHINAIKNHIDTLSNKNYQGLLDESPDTIFMFIPIEPAFAIASSSVPNLYEDAFVKQVIIVTPSTLLAALRLVDNLWKNDRQKNNALEIAKLAGSLYDSFTNLTDELLKVGTQIGTVQKTYESAMKKLTGRQNLINKVEKLKNLGAKTSKNIDRKLLKRAQEDDLEEEEVPRLKL